MPPNATIHRFELTFSDVDRGVYESFDLRVAQHPSETLRYLLTRVLAYCLSYEEGIAFTKGLADPDEPALWVKDLRGDLRVWIEIGAPSAERLHKASKASPRVFVFTSADPALTTRVAGDRPIHRADAIEVYAFAPELLAALEAATEKRVRWEIVHTGGELYVTTQTGSVSGAVTRHALTA